MTALVATITRFGKDCRAVTALEYGLIAAAVVAVGLAGFSILGTDLKAKFDSVQTEVAK